MVPSIAIFLTLNPNHFTLNFGSFTCRPYPSSKIHITPLPPPPLLIPTTPFYIAATLLPPFLSVGEPYYSFQLRTDMSAASTVMSAAANSCRPAIQLLRLWQFPILRQLQLEEALLRVDDRNWCIINDGAATPAIVMGISGAENRRSFWSCQLSFRKTARSSKDSVGGVRW